MKFPKAMKKMLKGKDIRREKWPKNDHLFLDEDFIRYYHNGLSAQFQCNADDIIADDWEVRPCS